MLYNESLNQDILNRLLPIPVLFNGTTNQWDFNIEYTGLVTEINPDGSGTIAEDGDTIQPLPPNALQAQVEYEPEYTGTHEDEITLESETLELSGVSTQSSFSISLKYQATRGGTIQGITEQTIFEGLIGTSVTAIADEGFNFLKWDDGDTNQERTDTPIRDVVYTAIFVENQDTNRLLYQYQE